MIQSINDVSDVFTHITVNVVWSGKKFRCLVSEVCGNYFVNSTICDCLVETFKTVGEETKCSDNEDTVCLSLL